MSRFALTILVTLAIWAGYRGYARLMGPLTRPSADVLLQIPTQVPVEVPAQPVNFARADLFLRGHEWTKQASTRIQVGTNAFVYFDEYELDGNRVELKPFAMVRTSATSPRERPYVIQCTGAHVTFEQEFKLGGESPGRILAAALHGEFTINGPNSLEIKGRDCWFAEDSHQLYSDQPIEFSYTPDKGTLKQIRGKADKLQILFEPTNYAVHGRDMPRVGEVVSVTLRRDVDLEFDVDNEGEVTTNHVASLGPFTYDMIRRLATFQDQVVVSRPTRDSDGKKGLDQLMAHALALEFEAPPPTGLAGAAQSVSEETEADDEDTESSPLGKLKLKMVHAAGLIPKAPVRVRSSAAQLNGVMQQLQYDALRRILTLTDQSGVVELTTEEVVLRTPHLRVEHDEHGELTGVISDREGRLDYTRPAQTDGAPQRFHALWNQRMTLSPLPAEELVLVVLEGDARVIQPAENGQMGLLCRKLTLEANSNRFERDSLSGTATTTKPAESKQDVPLKRAIAEGDVAMASDQFEIKTERLDVVFEAGRLPQGPTGQIAAPATTQLVRPFGHSDLTRVRRRRSRLSVTSLTQPSLLAAIGPRRGLALASVPVETRSAPQTQLAAEPSTPFRLSGNEFWHVEADGIEATIVQDPETQKADLQQVIGMGEVLIRQSPRTKAMVSTVPPTEESLTVTGQRLHLVNTGGIDQVLHLTGSPAKLDRAGVHLEGDELIFDREVNTAKVVGKGMMKFPVKASLSGEEQDQPSELNVYWLREMIFDGKLARFIEGVSARLDDSVMRCDEMHVTLNQRIDFSASKPDTKNIGIQTVLCQRGVEFQYIQWSEQSDPLVRAEGKAGEFELRYDTGDFEARGGGRLEVWQKNEQSRVEVDPQATAKANQPITASRLPWQYTEVIFHDKLVGNMHRKLATLYDRVWVTHAPVERALQRFTRDELSHNSESAKNSVWLGSDELTLSLHPWPGEERDYVAIQAIGRQAPVELEGRLFQATADTLTYDESTKLFTLRGLGQKPVSLAMQDRPGDKYNEWSGQQVQFNPARHSFSFQGSKGAFGSR
ncbi:MAG: hypothetical protein ACK5Q5_24880 [Planctomycetaceae bacterium]